MSEQQQAGARRHSVAAGAADSGGRFRVYALVRGVDIGDSASHSQIADVALGVGKGGTAIVDVLVRLADIDAKGRDDACWQVAESLLGEAAVSDLPPELIAFRIDGRNAVGDPQPYRLRPRLERVRDE